MIRSSHRPEKVPWLPLMVSLGLVPVMISGRSFWIDEFATWSVASLPSLRALIDRLVQTMASEGQMPLAMLASWSHLHLFGEGEWVLRAFNYPWLVTALVAAWAVGRRFHVPWFVLALAAHPFFWFYADEFRPYAPIIAASAVMLYALLKAVQDPSALTRTDTVVMGIAAVVLSGFSLLAMFSLGVYYAVAGLVIVVQRKSFSAFLRRLLWQVPFLLPLAAYYVSTLVRGASGAKLWHVNLASIAFSVYELAGFLGLGPGRVALREAGKLGAGSLVSAMEPFLIPVACLGLFYATVGVFCLKRGWRRAPVPVHGLSGVAAGFVFAALAANIGLLFLAAWVVGFPFWGRHLSPLLPHAVLGTVFAVSYGMGPGREAWGMSVFIALLLASSLQLRFLPRHEKDDYRGAAAIASAAVQRGQTVWWAASPTGARYYGLVSGTNDQAGSPLFRLLQNETPESLDQRTRPDTVIYSKPDIYDQRKALGDFLRDRSYRRIDRLPAFSIWALSAEAGTP